MIDGGLYYLPHYLSTLVVLVPRSFPDIDHIVTLSQNWTWAEFLEIVQSIAYETGGPPISSKVNLFGVTLQTAIPNFILHNENMLRELGMGGNSDDLRRALELYYELSSPELFQVRANEAGVFYFGHFRDLSEHSANDFRYTHAVLPLPTMFGERPLSLVSASHAVLTTGENTDLAVEILLEAYGVGSEFENPFTPIRPPDTLIERYTSLRAFDEYVSILENVNTVLQLPLSVTHTIHEAVDSFVRGVLTIDAAIDRITDIMWFYMNE